ncbi:MAG: hypothetical protein CMK45_07370 [Porticoccus sp.]|nr:hypothetical protein [Porticoccus sp.]|tara:strand:+ start:2775 stop:3005 length:231 start_codon:yes stop_codon:yes gene_type:complete
MLSRHTGLVIKEVAMNLNHREPDRILPKPAIPKHTASPEVIHYKPLPRQWQTDHRETDDQTVSLEQIVLNSDLDFF